MRIPFPDRVNPTHALIFATILAAVQVFEGTNPFFAGCVFCFILVATVAFNFTGGLVYPSGAFVFFNAFFTMVLPCVVKAVLRQPADSNLRSPLRTVEVYLCGMVAMLAAAAFSRRFRPRKAFIENMLPKESLRAAYIGSAVLSIFFGFYLTYFPNVGAGSFSSFLQQANRFPVLTFVLGVVYTIHRTGGRRSISIPLLCMIIFTSLNGLLSFSKELFLTPFFAWAITAALYQYRLHWINLVSFSVGLYLVVTFMVPYAAFGRSYVIPGVSPVGVSVYLLTHMDEVRQGYAEAFILPPNVRFYDQNLGLLSRLEVFSVDDALVDVTDREGAFGYQPLILAFANGIPHFLWPGKPVVFFGNDYAHEIGVLGDSDDSTGVSFSPSADAYHEGRLVGVLIVEPLVLMLIFLVLDSVIGNVRLNPVGLLTTILVSRAASEGALFGNISIIEQYLFTNVLVSWVCAYVLPVIGSAFTKPRSSGNGTPPAPASPLLHPVTSL